jgi:hypothetical protein
MIGHWQVTDRRSRRYLLDPEIFLDGSNPPPSDLVDLSLWDDLMHLADHASITTSNHHGKLLKRLYELERGWVHAIGEPHDWLSEAMIDVMDDFHASLFLLLHGFYRQSIATLRSVLETTLVGASLKLSGDTATFSAPLNFANPRIAPKIAGDAPCPQRGRQLPPRPRSVSTCQCSRAC